MRLTEETRQSASATKEEATIIVDSSGSIQSMNDQAGNLFQLDSDYTGVPIQELIPEITLSSMEQGAINQLFCMNGNGQRFSVFLRKNTFTLKEETFDLLVLHKNNSQSISGVEPQKLVNELLDIKFALDESTIVAITDQTGKITYINDKFCEISQYSREELIGQDHRIINSGHHSKDFIRNLWRTIANGKVWKGEIKNRAKDGSHYWVDTTIVPFMNEQGKPHQYLAIRSEITEHKRVVQELKNSMQELFDLKFALDESSIVAITDKYGKITYVNDQFVQISQYNREELIGQSHAIINSGYHPSSFFKELWRTIGTGNVWKGEIKNKARNGEFYWVDTTIVPFLDNEGKPYQYLAIRSEITKRKRIEEELQESLSRIIHVQEDERKRLSREIHDGIGQNLYSHLITINRLSTEMEHPLVTQMLEEASDLIQEVRDFSWALRPSVLDDLGLIPAIRSFLNRFSESYAIDVYFDSTLENRLESNVEITIYRIIQESLTNIRKYANVKQASITMRELEDSIRVVIEDSGTGFDTKQTSAGTGLLSMEERARSVEGELIVNTVQGKGTKVILDIPIVR